MKKIIFYGDSNTYGYDPMGFSTRMRYPEEFRWTTKVRKYFKNKYDIIEEGKNGRLIPLLPNESKFVEKLTKNLVHGDMLFVMLGTNDILVADYPNANIAIQKMNFLIDWFLKKIMKSNLFIIGPVPMPSKFEDTPEYHNENVKMNSGFKTICMESGIKCFDAGAWGIALACDGIHFSQEGHQKFANHIIDVINCCQNY